MCTQSSKELQSLVYQDCSPSSGYPRYAPFMSYQGDTVGTIDSCLPYFTDVPEEEDAEPSKAEEPEPTVCIQPVGKPRFMSQRVKEPAISWNKPAKRTLSLG